MNETNVRKQIVLAAIEKNKETDVEELLKKMAPKQKLLKEKLLSKLLWGAIIAFVGFSIFASNIWLDYLGGADPEMLFLLYVIGGILFGIGLAFIIYYFIGKKMLAKEIEAEEKKLTAEANL
jgi:formate/nitrite transporter FocA (FNT family)